MAAWHKAAGPVHQWYSEKTVSKPHSTMYTVHLISTKYIFPRTIGYQRGGQWSLTAKAFSPPYGNGPLKQVVCQFVCDKRE